jgi:hypothetical protein
MHAAKIPRMSPGLQFIGYTLWIPALLMMILGAGCGFVAGSAVRSASSNSSETVRRGTAESLSKIATIPRDQIDAFQQTGRFDRAGLSALPESDRIRAEATLEAYDMSATASGIGTGIAGGLFGIGIVAIYVVCLPLFIVGLLLTLHKKVWKCPVCGYVFDRA